MGVVHFVTLLVVGITLLITSNVVSGGGKGAYIEQQLNCALDQGPCDKLGLEIKGYLPEVIGRSCAKCTPQQVATVRRVIRFIQREYPEAWNRLLVHYGKKKKSAVFKAD